MRRSRLYGGLAAIAIPVLPIALPHVLMAQSVPKTTAATANRAAINLRDFDFLVEKIRSSYAGWDTKVTPTTKSALDTLTVRLRARATTASDDEFAAIARDWIGFFKDRHVQLAQFSTGTPPTDPKRVNPEASYPTLSWTEETVRARLASLGTKRDPIEGIWAIGGDRYRVGVLRVGGLPERFVAVVLATAAENWRPGQIKAEIARGANGKLNMVFRRGDHSEEKIAAEIVADGAGMKVEGWGYWNRLVPGVADTEVMAWQFASGEMFLKRSSPTTLWLRIPDFNESRYKPLKDLIEANRDELAKTPNLLIDLRENGGGSDYVYDVIQPYLYTRPIYTIGVEMRASADNLTLRRAVADRIRKDSPAVAAELDAQNVKMSENLGKYFVAGSRPFSVDKFDKILPFPKRVAVIIDGAGSTAEQFLLGARQSHKVTMFGHQNSAGVLDFANVVRMKLPSGRFEVAWATSRSMRLPDDPVDQGGIAPDIRIPETEKDPIKYVAAWLDRQRD